LIVAAGNRPIMAEASGTARPAAKIHHAIKAEHHERVVGAR